MLRHVLLVTIVLGSLTAYSQSKRSATTSCQKTGSFPTQCNPFGTASTAHPIDNTCGVSGNASDPGQQAQDEVKNNLCASGPGQEVTVSLLSQMQSKIDTSGLQYGNRYINKNLPPPPTDREAHFGKDVLRTPVGEKDLVFFVGYIAEAKTASPESVNCNCTGAQANDIHVALADHPLHLQKAAKNAPPATKAKITKSNNASLCTNSITAEVIPHLRPPELQQSVLSQIIDKKIVLVTGQLFFDASHHSCKGSTPSKSDPARIASWEIQPVYDIKICKNNTLAKCQGDVAEDWTALAP